MCAVVTAYRVVYSTLERLNLAEITSPLGEHTFKPGKEKGTRFAVVNWAKPQVRAAAGCHIHALISHNTHMLVN